MSHVITGPAEVAPDPTAPPFQDRPVSCEQDDPAYAEPTSEPDALRQPIAEHDRLLARARDEIRTLLASAEQTAILLVRQAHDLEQAITARHVLESRIEQLSALLAASKEVQGRLDHQLSESRRDLAVLKADATRAMRSHMEAELSKRKFEALEQELAVCKAELDRSRHMNAERDDELRKLRQRNVEEIGTLREQKDTRIKALRADQEARVKQVAELERRLEEIQASTSWRITGPLRRLRTVWRRT